MQMRFMQIYAKMASGKSCSHAQKKSSVTGGCARTMDQNCFGCNSRRSYEP